jgi:cell division protein FtsX
VSSDLVVVRSSVDGWDVVRGDDPQALTNTATKESAIEAAEAMLADQEGDGRVIVHEREVHELDDTSRGVKTSLVALLVLLAAVIVIIVVTALLASSTFS